MILCEGHYVPQLSQRIVRHNVGEKKDGTINLKGFMVGSLLFFLFVYESCIGRYEEDTKCGMNAGWKWFNGRFS